MHTLIILTALTMRTYPILQSYLTGLPKVVCYGVMSFETWFSTGGVSDVSSEPLRKQSSVISMA